ncbi:MAG: hypothetical protein Ta2B_19340 [Termitinemataceae bacterium]|nr:MAG: hypothetical protein Ta2B_19340 [Termitinemataceae bacterium]
METASQQPQMGLTFEQVWAALMETRQVVMETQQSVRETQLSIIKMGEDRKISQDRIDEQMKKTDEQMKRTDEQIKRMSRNLGGLGDSLGQLIETLIAAKLWKKFDAYPYNLKRAYQRVPLFDENNTILTDIDILLSNGEYVMAVEVKQRFHRIDDVERHLKRVDMIKKYPPAECKGKKLLGAIAGGTVDSDAKNCAHNAGFFVLELKGESVHLVEAPKDFSPRQW